MLLLPLAVVTLSLCGVPTSSVEATGSRRALMRLDRAPVPAAASGSHGAAVPASMVQAEAVERPARLLPGLPDARGSFSEEEALRLTASVFVRLSHKVPPDPSWLLRNTSPGAHSSDKLSGQESLRQQARELFSGDGPYCDFPRDSAALYGVWPPKEPAVFTNLTSAWAALRKWSKKEDFERDLDDVKFTLKTYDPRDWVITAGEDGVLPVTPREYHAIMEQVDSNFYLFTLGNFSVPGDDEDDDFKRLARIMRPAYQVPSWIDASDGLAVDGIASGHGWHRHGEAWMAQVAGRKVWWTAPHANHEAYMEEGDEEEGSPVFPYKDLSHSEHTWPCSWLLREDLIPAGKPIKRCMQRPGEVVVIPKRWWHQTCSIDDYNVAIGGQQ